VLLINPSKLAEGGGDVTPTDWLSAINELPMTWELEVEDRGLLVQAPLPLEDNPLGISSFLFGLLGADGLVALGLAEYVGWPLAAKSEKLMTSWGASLWRSPVITPWAKLFSGHPNAIVMTPKRVNFLLKRKRRKAMTTSTAAGLVGCPCGRHPATCLDASRFSIPKQTEFRMTERLPQHEVAAS
jgi:hypothetical protein